MVYPLCTYYLFLLCILHILLINFRILYELQDMGHNRIASHLQVEAEKKKTNESSRRAVLQFGGPEHRVYYRWLVDQRFIEGRRIDWPTLKRIDLADEV